MKTTYLVLVLSLFSAAKCLSQGVQGADEQISRESTVAIVKAAFAAASDAAPSDDRRFYEIFKRTLNERNGEKDAVTTKLENDSRYLANVRIMAKDAATKKGKYAPNVVGGNPTPADEFQDCVAITVNKDRCSGVLIGRNVVATAAHCVYGKKDATIEVLFGSDIQNPKAKYVVAPSNVHVFPEYDTNQNERHDLAILILSADINDPEPCPIAEPRWVDDSAYVRLAGFGIYDMNDKKNGVKHDVSVAVTSPACAGSRENTLYGCHKEHELVAGKTLVGKDTCKGDSGGPAYISVDNCWYLGGITSRPTKTAADCGDGGVYVRIDREPYRGWIRSVPGAHW